MMIFQGDHVGPRSGMMVVGSGHVSLRRCLHVNDKAGGKSFILY